MMSSSYKKLAISSSVVIGLIIIYEIISLSLKGNLLVPDFFEIIKNTFGILINIEEVVILLKTLLKIIIVIGISFVVSILIHFISYVFKYNTSIVNPFIMIMKSIPFAVVSVYLYILLFNNREIIPYIVSFLVMFPLVYDGTKGALSIDKNIIEENKLLNGPKYMIYRDVYLPMALPHMLITFLQAFSLGVKVMVMSEYIATVDNSIGSIINNAKLNVDFVTILSWLLLLIILVVIFDVLVGLLKKRISKVF